MTDIFTQLWERCRKEARAETIASRRVVVLNPDLPASQRAQVALETLQTSLDTLHMLPDSLPSRAYDQLRDAEATLSLLVPRVKLARSLVHLTRVMGRAP